ncbi:MAG: hypothetical protein ACLGHZ_11280 [Actinomycetes bacterium]
MTSQSFIHPDNAANEVAEDVQPPATADEAADPLRPIEPRDADSDIGKHDVHDGEEAVVDLDRPEDDSAEPSADATYIDVVDGRPETLGFDKQE